MLAICTTCGTQYAAPPALLAGCRVCDDDRQYVGWEGQRWTKREPRDQTAVAARGGIDMIVISHPHFYSAMVEWSEAMRRSNSDS